MEKIEIRPCRPKEATIRPPGSKSITNRALLIAALARGRSRLHGVLDSEDTRIMLEALRTLGTTIHGEPGRETIVEIDGLDGLFPVKNAELYVGNSGTTARFLTAALAFADGTYRMHGKARMHERPIGDLLDALRPLGARIECEHANGCPPLLLQKWNSPHFAHETGSETACKTDSVLHTSVSGAVSSQFLSALLMAAPLLCAQPEVRGVLIDLVGELVSKPYIDMTLRLMLSFGVSIRNVKNEGSGAGALLVPQASHYCARDYTIEPDASAASYFFAAAAVLGGPITVQGLSRDSLQGDVHFVDCLERMGAAVRWNVDSITVSRDPGASLRGITVDMNPISDTAQTLGCVALFAEGTTTITGIAHARLKETDRIAALATELRKFGAAVEEFPDGLSITPPPDLLQSPFSPVEVATYDDHRMAMSFAIVGLRRPGVCILDPRCTEKTYPDFFDDLGKIE